MKKEILLFPDTNHLPNIKEGQKLRYINSKLRSDNGYNHLFELLDD